MTRHKRDFCPWHSVDKSPWFINRQLAFIFFNICPCSEGAEYECPTDEQFQQKNGRLCMSLSLACDGLPNCGENIIPNADEACFKVTHSCHCWLIFLVYHPFSMIVWLWIYWSDPLVLCAAESDLLHPPGHHHAALHVLLCQDPHPVVSQVIHGGDKRRLREVIIKILFSLRRELQSPLGPAPAHLWWESEAHQPWPPAGASWPSALQRVFQSKVCHYFVTQQFSKDCPSSDITPLCIFTTIMMTAALWLTAHRITQLVLAILFCSGFPFLAPSWLFAAARARPWPGPPRCPSLSPCLGPPPLPRYTPAVRMSDRWGYD